MKGALREKGEQVVHDVAEIYGVTVDDLHSRSRRREICMARATICVMLEEYGLTHEMIGALLHRTTSAVYYLVSSSHPKFMQYPGYVEVFTGQRPN